jgi:enterochelin esterase-like enzyme
LVLATAALLLGPIAGPTRAEPAACPDTPHGFETFSLLAPALGWAKRILVYLPAGYDCAPDARYPVFYLNDGHDLFDWNPFAAELDPAVAAEIAERRAWYGSWHLENQLDRAIAEGRLPPLIVVGIAANDGMRSRDLVPVPWSGSFEGRGVQYGDFVAEIVVPAADSRFPTSPDRRCRGIGGASLGGVSALQIGLAHPERFGMVLAFSPVLGEAAIADYFARAWATATPAGPSEWLVDFDDDPIGRADRTWLETVVATAGEREVVLTQTPAGRHHIASWAERVVPALARLFAASCPG